MLYDAWVRESIHSVSVLRMGADGGCRHVHDERDIWDLAITPGRVLNATGRSGCAMSTLATRLVDGGAGLQCDGCG